jgi:hypothetical protein
MSFWIHAFCHQTVASVSTQELASGIAESLSLITYKFCPEKEEDPEEVLARLKIEDMSGRGSFEVFRLHYRADSPLFIRMDRHSNRASIEEMDHELLAKRPEHEMAPVRDLLAKATEDVSFSLSLEDVRGMGFPLAIAAARHLVNKAGGLILSGRYSWMVPKGKEVKILTEFEA